MPDKSRALSPIPPAQPPDRDYDAICSAVMATTRGRWFLEEYARRNRTSDTSQVLSAIARIERVIADGQARQASQEMRVELLEMARTIAQTRAEVAEAGPEPASPAKDVAGAAQRLRDIAWTMRACGIEPRTSEQIEQVAQTILQAPALHDDSRAQKLREVLHYLEHRIDRMLDGQAAGADAAPPAAVAETAIHDASALPAPEPASVPTDSVPTDSVPADSVPADSVPTDSVPASTAPPDSVPATDAAPSTGDEALDAVFALADAGHDAADHTAPPAAPEPDRAARGIAADPASVTDQVEQDLMALADFAPASETRPAAADPQPRRLLERRPIPSMWESPARQAPRAASLGSSDIGASQPPPRHDATAAPANEIDHDLFVVPRPPVPRPDSAADGAGTRGAPVERKPPPRAVEAALAALATMTEAERIALFT